MLALPSAHPRRGNILRLLANWKVRIDLGELVDFAEQEEIMALSEAFLAWETQTQQAERRSLILLQLEQKFGALPNEIVAQISALNLDQMARLAIALLNFTSVSDLTAWLNQQ